MFVMTCAITLILHFYLFLSFCVQGVLFELDAEMVADDDDRELLQDIINNSKLSEGYLNLARDIEVMEPKSPEDIYKVCEFVLSCCFVSQAAIMVFAFYFDSVLFAILFLGVLDMTWVSC